MTDQAMWTNLCWQLTLTLLYVSAAGMAIGAIIRIANGLLRSASAHVRYWANYSALILFVACLPAALMVNRSAREDTVQVREHVVQTQAVSMVATSGSVSAEEFRDAGDSFAAASPGVESKTRDHEEAQLESNISQWLTGHRGWLAASVSLLYVAGVIAMLVRLGWNISNCEQLRTRCRPLSEGSVFDSVRQQAGRLHLQVLPAVALCERIAVPAIVGILRPTILLPTAMVNSLSVEQLESVLLHELAHLKRADHIFIVVQRIAEAILFFHPLTWYLSRRIHREREQACDEMVLAAGTDPVRYAESLLRVAEWKSQRAASSQSTSTMLAVDGDRPSHLRQRIARVLGEPATTEFGLSGRWLFVVVAAAVVCSFAVTTLAGNGDEEAVEVTSQNEADSPKPTGDTGEILEEFLRLSKRARSIVESIRTAHVVFNASSGGWQRFADVDVEVCRELLMKHDLVKHPEQQTDLVRSLFEDPESVRSPAWSEIELFTDGDHLQTSRQSGDVHLTDKTTSVRWDAGNMQMNVKPVKENVYAQSRLHDFLQPMKWQQKKIPPNVEIQLEDDVIHASFRSESGTRGEASIDRSTGFFRRMTRYAPDGSVKRESHWLGWTSSADSPPFPTVYADFSFREGQLERYDVRTVTKARFNIRLPEDIFRLGAPAGAAVFHFDSGSGRINREVFDGTNRNQLKAAFKPLSDELTPEEQAGVADARRLYTLKDGETLKRITPPFPRSRRFVSRMLGERFADPPAEWSRLMSFDGENFEQVFSHTNGSSRLGSHVQRLTGIYGTDLVGDAELLDLVMAGDVVFRRSAPVAELLRVLETVVEEEVQRPISIEFRTVKRPVFKVSGEFKLKLPDGQSRIAMNAGEHRQGEYGEIIGRGSPTVLLQSLAGYIKMKVVVDTDLPDERLIWQERWYDLKTTKPEDRFEFDYKVVLQKISEQTGLTFREEERDAEVLFVEFDES